MTDTEQPPPAPAPPERSLRHILTWVGIALVVALILAFIGVEIVIRLFDRP